MNSVPRRLRVIILALVTVSGLILTASTATARTPGTEHLPDLQTIIPTNAFSVVNTAEGREFRYTHLVYNNGPGPLEIQPSYDDAIGGFRGRQLILTHDAAGAWSQVRDRRVPDTFVFHAEHGHFHFPLASFGLYAVAPDGGFGDSRRGVAEERLLHRRLLPLQLHPRAQRRVPGEPEQLRRSPRPAGHLRRRGRRVRLPRSRPGGAHRRAGRRHVLVPGHDRPQRRHGRARREQQRDRRQGDDLPGRGDPGAGPAPGHHSAPGNHDRPGRRPGGERQPAPHRHDDDPGDPAGGVRGGRQRPRGGDEHGRHVHLPVARPRPSWTASTGCRPGSSTSRAGWAPPASPR